MTDYACRNVWDNEQPVLFVRHDHNGDWQMLCGGYEHGDAAQIFMLHKEHLIDRDQSLQEIVDLPLGWEAERETAGRPWRRGKFSAPDD